MSLRPIVVMSIVRRIVLSVAGFGLASPFIGAAAMAGEPLDDRDNGPVSGIVSFPDSTEGAVLLERGRFAGSLLAMTSSHAIATNRDDEILIFDGETTRLELGLRYGVGERLELGLRVPYLRHSAGNLDSLIDGWHDLFGLPGGSRETRASDLLEFSYVDASGSRLDLRDSAGDFGDLRLMAGWRLDAGGAHRRALRFGLTLPTGSVDSLTGAEAVTVSAGLAGDIADLGADGRLNAFYRANLVWVDEPGILADRYRDWIGQLAAGFGYRASSWLEVRAQALLRTATHDSELEVLGEPAVTLTFGGNLRLSRRYVLSVAVGEDIKVNSSPDVSFQLTLRYQPAASRKALN